MTVYGYIRVSSRDQNEARQLIAMETAGVPAGNIFIDKQSGKDFDRPAYQKMMNTLKTDDLLYIKSIDRLGRDYEQILAEWRRITKEIGCDIVVLDMTILDTRIGKDLFGTFINDMILQIMSFFAENERKNIRQRQAEGIIAAKQKGVRFGRPALPLPDNFYECYGKWKNGEISASEAARNCDMAVSTFRRKARELEEYHTAGPS